MSVMDELSQQDMYRLRDIAQGLVKYFVHTRTTRDPRTRRVRIDDMVIRCRILDTDTDVTVEVARLIVAGYAVNPSTDMSTFRSSGYIVLTEEGRAVAAGNVGMDENALCNLCEIEHVPAQLTDIILETAPLAACRKCLAYLPVIEARFYVF